MRKLIVTLMILGSIMMTVGVPSYASDWDKAGKILTGIEGLRIITGGKVDVIGSLTGLNDNRKKREVIYIKSGRVHSGHRCFYCSGQVWIPEKTTYKHRYIPRHKEYSEEYGTTIIVEGHYIKYPVKEKAYWILSSSHHSNKYCKQSHGHKH